MIINKNIIIKGTHHKPILSDVFYNDNQVKKPIVIFAHGYKGYKDWGAWNLVAKAFANSGFVFIKFNFFAQWRDCRATYRFSRFRSFWSQ